MDALSTLENRLWLLTEASAVALILVLIVSKNYRQHKLFTLYIAGTLVQNAILISIYRRWGFSAPISIRIAWSTQFTAIFLRSMAILELCRFAMRRYPGIWRLTWQTLLACASLSLLISLLLAGLRIDFLLLYVDRGLELSIAAAIVILFVFIRFYQVDPGSVVRSIAVGFCLYSLFFVLNDTILERRLAQYSSLWNLLGTLTFLSSLFVWIYALRVPQPEVSSEQVLLPATAYAAVIPQVNDELRLMSRALDQIWKIKKS